MNPQLAKDVDLDTLPYPDVWGMPKIDGVRALADNQGNLTGRSLDKFTGYGQTDYWSREELADLDGEMIAGFDPAATDLLCNRSTSAMGAFKDITERAVTSWWIFDDTLCPDLPYKFRYARALQRVEKLQDKGVTDVFMVPYRIIQNKAEAEAFISEMLDAGYEGAVFRNTDAAAKEGRPTKKGQELMRYKPWMDSEALVTGVIRGETNNNVKTTNALGKSERSSHKANKVPNDKVGKLEAILIADIFHPTNGRLLFAKGLAVTLNTGKATDKMLKAWLKDPTLIVNHIVKFQHMAHGVKDLPRFGGYVSHRLKQDM